MRKREKPLFSIEKICEMNDIPYGDSVESNYVSSLDNDGISNIDLNVKLFDEYYLAHDIKTILLNYSMNYKNNLHLDGVEMTTLKNIIKYSSYTSMACKVDCSYNMSNMNRINSVKKNNVA